MEVGLHVHAFLHSTPVAVVDLIRYLVALVGGLGDWVFPRASLGAVKNREISASALFPDRSSGTHFSITYGVIYPGPNNKNNNQTSTETVLSCLLTYFMEHSPS
jgi:hypothetical protein